MTFFFQTNPIRVILKIILAIPSVIIAVGRCFCSTVQNTLNKARASIVKHASHRSGVWILASCSESMHFLKKNIHISNVINTFLSLPLSVVRGSRSGGWLRMFESRACLWDMIVSQVCLQEQSKQSFLTLAKENQSPLGSYRHPLTFFFTNPRFVLLIHDWRFFWVFFSAFVTNHAMPTSYVIRRNGFWSERKVFITFEIWIFFLQKCMASLQEAFIHPPEPCEAHFIMDARALFDVFWTVEQKHLPIAMIEFRRARTIFNITPIGFVCKKKVIYT